MTFEHWNLGLPLDDTHPFYSIVSESGKVIALRIPSREIAETIIAEHRGYTDAYLLGQRAGREQAADAVREADMYEWENAAKLRLIDTIRALPDLTPPSAEKVTK